MMLDEELREFLRGPVMQVFCLAGPGGRPVVGRGVGLVLPDGGDLLELVVSRWQWPAAAALMREGAAVAATFMQPATCESWQLKGRMACVPVTARHLAAADAYIAATFALLQRVGLPRPSDGAYFACRDPVVARLTVEQVFQQTPGPHAGRPWGATA